MKIFSFALPLGLVALVAMTTAPVSSSARDGAASPSVLQIRFVDSATGYAIQPESIVTQAHRAGSTEQRVEPSQVEKAGRAWLVLERGRHTVTATSSNYLPISGEVEVGEANPHRIQFMLDPIVKPRELQADYIETLHRDGEMLLQGFIVDEESGEPLRDVRVSSQPSAAETATDARGFFQFYVPVPAKKKSQSTSLILQKPGYSAQERQYLEIWSRGDRTYCIRLERGSGREITDERASRRHHDLEDESEIENSNVLNAQPSTLNSPAVFEDTVELASTAGTNATVRVPRNIRVEDNGIIYYVTMNYYVKHTLTHEWIASWSTNSLNAGAVAVRCYAISRLNGKAADSNHDICGDSNCQNFKTVDTTSRGDRAVDYTEDYVLINNSGNIPSTEYSSENNSIDRGDCGDGFTAPTSGCLYDPVCIGKERSGHGRGMCQRGSERWSTGSKGYAPRDWIWILKHYYPTLRLVKGAPLVIGDDIKSRSGECQVRACPGGGIENGTSCALITTKSSGQTGVIIDGPLRVMADDKGFTWYRIQWNDAGSTIGWSCENFIERVFPLPTAPTSLIATAVSTNRINLAWTDTSDFESNFDIERAPAATGPWIEIGGVGANVTSYSDQNLLPANTWHYRVRARNAGGVTSYTSVASATTLGAVAPTLSPIPDRTIAQGSLFTFTASASAPDRVQVVTDFEPFMSDGGNGVILFQTPTNSVTTRNFINTVVNVGTNNVAVVTDNFPISGHTTGNVFLVTCEFTNATNPWLRLTTDGTATLPSPVINFSKKLRFNIRSTRDIRVALGCRETVTPSGTAIGSSGGVSGAVEWVGVNNVVGGAPVPTRLVSSNSWTTLTFDFPNESIRNFSGGNGILSTASGLGVLEHLAIVPMGGMGVYDIYLDNVVVVGSPKFTFALGTNAPTGASINPLTGVFAWTPTQSQTPSTNSISVIVTDDNLPPLSTTNTFTVVVKENVPNSAPFLAPIENRSVNAGGTVTFTNSAFDPNPSDALTFTLDPGAPPAASVHSTSGVFTWTTAEADANTVKNITVRATDNGTPPLSGTASFSVTVLPKNNPPLLAPVNNRSVHAYGTVNFTNLAFDPNPGDVLTFSLDPGAPADASINPNSGIFAWTTTEAEAYSVNSITVRVTDSGQPPLSGTVVFSVAVYPELMIESVAQTNNAITLMWNAIPGATYQVEYKETLEDAAWQPGPEITTTNEIGTATDNEFDDAPHRFYRVRVQ